LLPAESEATEDKQLIKRTWTEVVKPDRFAGLLELRDHVLESASAASPMEKALMLEDYLASSGEFTYSMRPRVNRANGLDPIEDFAANHRTGHCQYFASTLAIMLRSIGLPSRIVIGFRPEYNEVGGYFVVRQRHAHAWVEVHLDVDELEEGRLQLPPWVRRGIWLRLDPTPIGEGSNAGGSFQDMSRSDQTLDAMEQLWKDQFMGFDTTRQPEGLGIFGASGDGTIATMLRSVERVLLQMQSRALGGEELSTLNWFSWKAGLSGVMTAVLALLVFRFRERLHWSLGARKSRSRVKGDLYHTRSWTLYRQMMKAFKRMGLHRRQHQTPLEFIVESQKWLEMRQLTLPSGSEGLRSIVDAFYALRYGEHAEPMPDDWESLESTVHCLDKISKANRSAFRFK